MKEKALVRIVGPALAIFALAACTASPYVPEDKFAQAADSRLMVVTGPRIPQMVDMNESNPRLATPTSIITAEDIRNTGETSLCGALMRYVPNMIRPDPFTRTRGSLMGTRC